MTQRLSMGLRFAGLVCASTSVGALLAQFYGVASMRAAALAALLPACAALAGLGVGGRRVAGGEFTRRLLIGIWAGWWATVAYDLWRVPFFLWAMNPFKGNGIKSLSQKSAAWDAALGGNARPRRLPYADSGSGSFLG